MSGSGETAKASKDDKEKVDAGTKHTPTPD